MPMNIIGISPLDKDATACLLVDGEVVMAIAEERLSRIKIHSGFPYKAINEIFRITGLKPDDIDVVAYAFADWQDETILMQKAIEDHLTKEKLDSESTIGTALKNLPSQPNRQYNIPGLDESELYMVKNPIYKFAYKTLSTNQIASQYFSKISAKKWLRSATADHKKWSSELHIGLKHYGLQDKLHRVEHHLTHAANAYYNSGFNNALIVTLDGYGSGLGGSVSIGREGKIERLHSLPYPTSLGEFYERVTSSLGFQPGRHEGKIVGLAAYEDPNILLDVVKSFFSGEGKNLRYRQPHNYAISRHLASNYAKPTVAAAYQKLLEIVACDYVRPFLKETGLRNVVLSGGVVANVKANQRIFEMNEIDGLFIHPNMGDGGCCVGAAQSICSETHHMLPKAVNDVYWGPEYSDDDIEDVLKKSNVQYHLSDDEIVPFYTTQKTQK